jgi:hypothetical protein
MEQAMKPRLLVACEHSGVVRDAFLRKGWDAISCDLLPTESEGPHYVGDVRDLLNERWDMMIAHPPCTYLCNSGVRWLYNKDGTHNVMRWGLTNDASDFFQDLLSSPIEHIAIENPIPHKWSRLPKPTQTIQPWMFGHGETKATCLWLKNLPKLTPTNVVEGREQRIWKLSPSKDRWKERSRTFLGIADAMAVQWSKVFNL